MSGVRLSRPQGRTSLPSTPPRLFEYFAVVALEQTNFNLSTKSNIEFNSKDMGFRPVVKYAYNAYKFTLSGSLPSEITSAPSASTALASTSLSSLEPSPSLKNITSNEPKDIMNSSNSSISSNGNRNGNGSTVNNLTAEQIEEECEVLMQMRKFCFPDLSDIVKKYLALVDKYKTDDKYFRALFQHPMQSEKFEFVFTKSGTTRLYGHCRRVYSIQANGKCSQMPMSLCLITKHPYLSLSEQIMDYVLARWLCCPEAIFPLLDSIANHSTPSLGDVFHIRIKSQIPNAADDVATLWLQDTNYVSLRSLLMTLSIDVILLVLSCVLTEKRIVFTSESLEKLTGCINGIMALIYPFRWQHIFIPVLPEQLFNLLTSPLPFVIGVKSYLIRHLSKISTSEIVLVDLDTNSIKSSYSQLIKLPPEPTLNLKRELTRLLKKAKEAMSIEASMDLKDSLVSSTSTLKIKKLKIFDNMHDVAKGWDDLIFFDAFLAYFVIFIGDWQNFYQDDSPTIPIPPFHLATEETQQKSLSSIIKTGHPLAKTLQAQNINPTTTTTANLEQEQKGNELVTVTPNANDSPRSMRSVDVGSFDIGGSRRRSISHSVSASQSAQYPAYIDGSNPDGADGITSSNGDNLSSGGSNTSLNSSQPSSSNKASIGEKYMGGLKNWGGKLYRAATNTVASMTVSINKSEENEDEEKIDPRESLSEKNEPKRESLNTIANGGLGKTNDLWMDPPKKKTKDLSPVYDEEALKYLEVFCQTQLFQTWFNRQKENALNRESRVYGTQERFENALYYRTQYTAVSYSNCLKYIRATTMSRENVMNVTINLKKCVDDVAALTSNKEPEEYVKYKEKYARQLASGAYDPRVFTVLNNLLDYRLKDTIGKNYPHGLMGLYLLRTFLEKSTDRYVIMAINSFLPLLAGLTRYKNSNERVQSDMRDRAHKLYQLVTVPDHLRKARTGLYVAFKDLYDYQYREEEHLESIKKSNLIDEKLISINFSNLKSGSMDEKQQHMLADLLGLASDFFDPNTLFAQTSQFDARDPNIYRAKMISGEVKMIPPFDHLYRQFRPPESCLVSRFDDDDDDIIEKENNEINLMRRRSEELELNENLGMTTPIVGVAEDKGNQTPPPMDIDQSPFLQGVSPLNDDKNLPFSQIKIESDAKNNQTNFNLDLYATPNSE